METKQYAPVIIPTLNRYEHFKRCLDSLERCTGADKTDVYVGLDYPPSEKYVEGWEKIDAYLIEKEKKNGFKNLYVRRRNHNCGVCKEGSNVNLLYEEVSKISDRFILVEDDNEYSPNFLEYINYGLHVFKNDPQVKAISGFLPPMVPDFNEISYFKTKFSNAWGTGYWTSKTWTYLKIGAESYIHNVLRSWKKSLYLWEVRAASLNGFLSMYFYNKTYGDVLKTAEAILEKEYSIFPKISKVRNYGNDGSGVHSGKNKIYQKQIIDTAIHFQYDKKIACPILDISPYMDFEAYKKFFVLLRYISFRLFHKDLFSIYYNHIK